MTHATGPQRGGPPPAGGRHRGRPVRQCSLAVLVATIVAGGAARACSVPVFRYALEHWESDPYRLTLYHDGPSTPADEALAAWLGDQAEVGANLELRRVDLAGDVPAADAARWATRADQTTPALLVQPPLRTSGRTGVDALPAAAAWHQADLEHLVDSPARAELARRLAGGEVVWVLLESGDAERDEPLRALLDRQLAILETTLELPESDDADASAAAIDADELRIRFSSLAVSRSDPTERWLVEMLLSVEGDLRDDDVAGEPMVFPVFGRGRALYALIGRGINAETIRRAAEFLTGACQCTIKAENPGVDLLMRFAWHEHVTITPPEDVAVELTGLAALPMAALPATDSPEPQGLPAEPAGPADRRGDEPVVDSVAEGPDLAIFLPMLVLLALGLVVALAALRRSRPAA